MTAEGRSGSSPSPGLPAWGGNNKTCSRIKRTIPMVISATSLNVRPDQPCPDSDTSSLIPRASNLPFP